jgi:hypothetical protein
MKTMAMKLLRRIGGDWFWGRWRRSTLVLFSSGFSLVFFFFFFWNDEAPVFSVFPFPFLSVFLSCIPLSAVLGVAVGMKKMMSWRRLWQCWCGSDGEWQWLLGWRRWWADDGVGSAGAVVIENGSGSSPVLKQAPPCFHIFPVFFFLCSFLYFF